MNNVKKAYFAGSWYPGTERDVVKQIHIWEKELPDFTKEIVSGVVPHGGWYFSGSMAYDVIRRIDKETEVLLVLGGHLPSSGPIYYCNDDYMETPCGNLPIAREYMNMIAGLSDSIEDKSADNTIEVQLPIIRALFKNIQIIPVRVPSSVAALRLVREIEHYSVSKNIKLSVIGSTDLTHYGPNYNYSPLESLSDPQSWVERTDKNILNKMTEMKPFEILKEAEIRQCACSAGAAAGAALYASLKRGSKGILLKYDTSLSKHRSDSFVGYGSVIYEV